MKINQDEQKKKKTIIKDEDSSRDIWDNIKHNNIHIVGVPEEGREKGVENSFEVIIAENSPSLGKEWWNSLLQNRLKKKE